MNYFLLKHKYFKLSFKVITSVTFSSLFLIFGIAKNTPAQDLLEQLDVNPPIDFDLENQLNINPRINFDLDIRNNADQQIQLGLQALEVGNLDQTLNYWLEALALYESIPDLDGIGKASQYLGGLYVELGDFALAENSMRRRLAITRGRGDQYRQIHSLNNLGTLLLEMGRNFEEIDELFTEALEISEEVDDVSGIGLSLNNLGRLAYFQGDYIKAIDFYQSAIPYRYEANDTIGQANTLNNLGDAYQEIQEYWESISSYRRGKVAAETVGELNNQYRALEGISESFGALGFHNRAFTFLNQWVNLAIATQNARQQLKAIGLSAYFYGELGDKNNASIFYEQAIELATALGADQEVALLKNQYSQAIYGDRY